VASGDICNSLPACGIPLCPQAWSRNSILFSNHLVVCLFLPLTGGSLRAALGQGFVILGACRAPRPFLFPPAIRFPSQAKASSLPKRQALPGAPVAWFYHVLRYSNSTDAAEIGRGTRVNASVLKANGEDVSVVQRTCARQTGLREAHFNAQRGLQHKPRHKSEGDGYARVGSD